MTKAENTTDHLRVNYFVEECLNLADTQRLLVQLLIKRECDGINNRKWDAFEHLDAEKKIRAILNEYKYEEMA